jgi:hypothetical protein
MQMNLSSQNRTTSTQNNVRFALGQIVATPGALDAIEEAGQLPRDFINGHARLEQGELSDDDYRENLYSVDKQLRIFSAYKTVKGEKLWLITEADRSATTILLPSEY